jgi:hypothetical protein
VYEKIEPITIVCSWCGSADVSRDAWASWDVEKQDWVLSAVFDNGFCHACGVDRSLVEAPIETDAIDATSVAT